jgi:nitrite reductase (NADH) large subunit
MKYVIIGNSAAGNAAAEAIVAADPGGEVTIVSDEAHDAYYRPLIANLVDETVERGVLFRDEETGLRDVERRLGQGAERIDPIERRVFFEGGESIPYERLLLATGSSALRPPVGGMDGEGVFTLRTLDDAVSIRGAAEGVRNAVVIGGGRVGMKAAAVLKHKGLEVSVVEKFDHVVPLQFDDVAGEIVGSAVAGRGIDLILGRGVAGIVEKDGRVKAVELEDGRHIEARLVLVATGVEPNTGLARDAGIAVNRGVLVDPFMRTSLADIYAAGDVVETPERVTDEPIVSGLWTNAVGMGTVAGRNMAGGNVEYAGAFSVLNALDLGGIPTVSIGLTNPPSGEGYDVRARRRGDRYRKLVFREDVLVGALLLGDIEGAGVYTGLIGGKKPLGSRKESLIEERATYAAWFHGAAGMV